MDMADTTPSTPYGAPYFSSVKADNIDPQSNIGAGEDSVPLQDVAGLVKNVGAPGGVAQLDNKAQLYLQNQSVLAVTPATSATSADPATPAMLLPLLPLHADTPIGQDGATLGAASERAAGAVQADGGNASTTVVIADNTPTPRQIAAIAADTAHLDQFRAAGVSDTSALTNANTALKALGRKVLHLPPGATVEADGTSAAQSLGDTLLYGDKTVLDGALGFAAHDWYQRSAFQLYKSILPEQLANLHAVCAQSQADGGQTIVKIITAGDSLLSEGDNPVVSDEVAGVLIANVIIAQLQSVYPAAKFQFINRCLGGTTWNDWASTTEAAAEYFGLPTGTILRDSLPVDAALIIWNCGGNDGFGFVPANFVSAVTYTASRCPNATQVFIVNSSSSITPSNTWININGVQWAYSWIYSYCRVYGYSYVDVDSWVRMRRDGYYPHAVTLDRIGDRATWFDQPITLDSSGTHAFPATTNNSGVAANACTDFHVMYAFPDSTTTAEAIEIRIGGGDPLTRVYLGFNGGTSGKAFSLTTDDGTNAERSFVSIYDAPTNPLIGITVRDNRLRVIAALPAQSQNGFDPTGLGSDAYPSASIGLGFFEIFNIPVVRWRTQYAPSVIGLPTGVKLINLAVADASRKNPTVQPVRPDVTMYGLYDSSLGAGGNDIAHMNAFGWRETMVPPFAQQDWRPIIASGIQIDSKLDSPVINNAACLRYGDNYHLDILGGYMSDGASGVVTANGNRRAWTGYVQGYSWHSYDGSTWSTPMYLAPAGNLALTGGIGAFGKTVSTQPALTGTKPTDPIVQQLVNILAANGSLADQTS